MIRLRLLVGITLGLATTPCAADAPPGGDSIPYLTSQAKSIIQTDDGGAKLTEVGRLAKVFTVQAVDILRGDQPVRQPIRIAILGSGLGPKGAAALDQSLIFLDSPVDPDLGESLGIATVPQVFLVLSGAAGVLPATGDRPKAVREYIQVLQKGKGVAREKATLKWAESFYRTKDDLLQYSTILAGTREMVGEDDAVEFSRSVLKEPIISPTNKAITIQELKTSLDPKAVDVLYDFASELPAQDSLKAPALAAMAEMPKGLPRLIELSQSKHSLSMLARETLDNYPRSGIAVPDSPPGDQVVANIQELLESEEADDRIRGLREIQRIPRYNAKLGDIVGKTALNGEREPAERQLAITTIASVGQDQQDVSDLLASIARNSVNPIAVREASVLGLDKMTREVAEQPLRSLIATLAGQTFEEIGLKKLAAVSLGAMTPRLIATASLPEERRRLLENALRRDLSDALMTWEFDGREVQRIEMAMSPLGKTSIIVEARSKVIFLDSKNDFQIGVKSLDIRDENTLLGNITMRSKALGTVSISSNPVSARIRFESTIVVDDVGFQVVKDMANKIDPVTYSSKITDLKMTVANVRLINENARLGEAFEELARKSASSWLDQNRGEISTRLSKSLNEGLHSKEFDLSQKDFAPPVKN